MERSDYESLSILARGGHVKYNNQNEMISAPKLSSRPSILDEQNMNLLFSKNLSRKNNGDIDDIMDTEDKNINGMDIDVKKLPWHSHNTRLNKLKIDYESNVVS